MKNSIYLGLILLTSFFSTFSAMQIGGTYCMGSFSSLKAPVKVTETGKIEGNQSYFYGSIENNGIIELEECWVHSTITSYNSLNAKKTEFKESLSIVGGVAYLDNCKLLKDLVVKASAEDKETVIKLTGKTIIDGSITFESAKVKVYKGPDVIIKGDVNNGTLITLENDEQDIA